MKKLYTAVLLTSIVNPVFANPVITGIGNGNWQNNSTWTLNRMPANGDTVVIPAGKTVIIEI